MPQGFRGCRVAEINCAHGDTHQAESLKLRTEHLETGLVEIRLPEAVVFGNILLPRAVVGRGKGIDQLQRLGNPQNLGDDSLKSLGSALSRNFLDGKLLHLGSNKYRVLRKSVRGHSNDHRKDYGKFHLP
jgi:hypothetical protein